MQKSICMTYIARPDSKAKEKALKAVFEALEITYEKKDDECSYNPEFIEKIKQGEEDLKAGRFTKMTLEELDSLWK